MTLEPNSLIVGRYRVVRPVGRGGMGAVYEAVDERLRAPVALKQMAVSAEGAAAAFEREAQILAGLRHPSLPRVIDHFADPAGQFLVMEFIPGDDMAALLAQRGGPFPPGLVLGWADQLLDALDYLHARTPPVIHRDIKPQNIKLGPRGEPILLDFGLAKGSAALATAAPAASFFGYTPQYAPLEQVQGGGTGPPADLFSLAATLYHLLTGQPPADALARADAALNGRPDPLRPAHDLRPELPPALGALLAQALALPVAGRFASAAAMRAALRSVPAAPSSAGAPTVAGLPPPREDLDAQPAGRAVIPSAGPGPDPRPAEGPPAAPPAQREAPAALRLPTAPAGPPGLLPPANLPRPPILGPRLPAGPGRLPADTPLPRRLSARLLPLLAGLLALLLVCGGALYGVSRLATGGGAVVTQGAPQPELPAPVDPREQAAPVADLPPAQPVELDAQLAGEIRSPGQRDVYAFAVPEGGRLFVWTFSYDSGMEQIDIALLAPDGRELARECLGCGNMGLQELRAPGEYRLVVGDTSDPAVGAYDLRLNLAPDPAEFTIGDDARIAGPEPAPAAAQIGEPGAWNIYRLAAAPGEQLFVTTLDHDPGMEQIDIALLDPDGREIARTCLGCGNMGLQPLRQGGSYTLVVGDTIDPAVGAYELRVNKVPPPRTFAVSLPLAVAADAPEPGAGTIDLPGAAREFRFSGRAGQEIFVRTVRYDPGMEQLDVVLLGPDGQELHRECLGCGDMGLHTLGAAGEYRVVVGDTTEGATGTFAIEVTSPQ